MLYYIKIVSNQWNLKQLNLILNNFFFSWEVTKEYISLKQPLTAVFIGVFSFTRNSVFLLFARSEIITVEAENINDPKTNNSKIAYEILSQEPQVSNGF